MVELQKEIVNLRMQGFTYHKIQEKLNCPLLTIQKACNRADIIFNNITRISDAKIIEIKKIYQETKSQRKTAEIVGCSKSTVGKYVTGINPYKRNPKSKTENVIAWRRRTKLKLVEYKGGKCKNCGYNKCPEALTFHHLDPSQKDFTISGKSWSFERLQKEVDKCILVCANCHIEVHAGVIKI